MHTIDNITETKWVLCHNSAHIFHIVKLEIGNKLETGQPYIEEFDTEEQLEQRINEINPTWFAEYKIKKEDNIKKEEL